MSFYGFMLKLGDLTDTAWDGVTSGPSLVSIFKRAAAGNPASLGQKTAANSTSVVPALGASVTDRSGTIISGATAQQLMAANASRRYLLIQNTGTSDLWFNFTTTAVQTQPSVSLPIGATFIQEGSFVSPELISIIGPTTGQAFTAKEG